MDAEKGVAVLIGVVLAAIQGTLLISKDLVPYSEAVRVPLIGGGVFGLISGAIMALMGEATRRAAIAGGVLGFLSLYFFYDIVSGERAFAGRGLALFACAFVLFGALFFLTTSLTRLLARPWMNPPQA